MSMALKMQNGVSFTSWPFLETRMGVLGLGGLLKQKVLPIHKQAPGC